MIRLQRFQGGLGLSEVERGRSYSRSRGVVRERTGGTCVVCRVRVPEVKCYHTCNSLIWVDMGVQTRREVPFRLLSLLKIKIYVLYHHGLCVVREIFIGTMTGPCYRARTLGS